MRQIILPEEKLHELAQLSSDRILTNHYYEYNDGVIKGEELKSFADHEQINRFLLFRIFQIWNVQINKLKHPYFDFDNEEIQETLKVLQNQLSLHISIGEEDFRPLLKRAIYNNLKLVLNPQELFTSFFFVNRDQISIDSFEKHLAFFSDFDFIVNSIFRYHKKHGLAFVEKNTFFEKMEKVISLYNSKTDADIEEYRSNIFLSLTQRSLESVISESKQLEEERKKRLEEEKRRKEEREFEELRRKREAEEQRRKEEEERLRLEREKEKAEQERLREEKLKKTNFFDTLSKEDVFFDLEEEDRTENKSVSLENSYSSASESVSDNKYTHGNKDEFTHQSPNTPIDSSREKMDALTPKPISHPSADSSQETFREDTFSPISNFGSNSFDLDEEEPSSMQRSQTDSKESYDYQRELTPPSYSSDNYLQNIPSSFDLDNEEEEEEETQPSVPATPEVQNGPSSVFDSLTHKRSNEPDSSKDSGNETTASFLNRFLNSKKDDLLVKEEQNAPTPERTYTRPQTIGDKLKSQSQTPKVHENINGNKKIKLNEIPIHKQYQYVQKVFEGNNVRFRIIVDKVNNAQNKDEVESILEKFVLNNDKIDKVDPVVKEFLELLRNRF